MGGFLRGGEEVGAGFVEGGHCYWYRGWCGGWGLWLEKEVLWVMVRGIDGLRVGLGRGGRLREEGWARSREVEGI